MKKQKDVEAKQTLSHGSNVSAPNTAIDSATMDVTTVEELRQFKQQLQDQESKWRSAFERAMKENEQLRARSNEAALIAQLREQNESCTREKNELIEKLKIYEKVLHDSSSSSGSKSLEQSYIELRDEYRVSISLFYISIIFCLSLFFGRNSDGGSKQLKHKGRLKKI